MSLRKSSKATGISQTIQTTSAKTNRFVGVFDGYSVVIEAQSDVYNLVCRDAFGKSSLSRSHPQLQENQTEIVRDRVFQKRQSMTKIGYKKVVVIPDSDSNDEYFTDLKPVYKMDRSGVTETVNLCTEEAFFLTAVIDCLDIYFDGKLLDCRSAWELFENTNKYFVQNFVAYHHFRSKNWVVKPGIKYGGDFLLYKQGPAFNHASYVVIVHVSEQDSSNNPLMLKIDIMGLNRLCESTGKELLICEIKWPEGSTLNQTTFKNLSQFMVKEIVVKRWTSCQKPQDQETVS